MKYLFTDIMASTTKEKYPINEIIELSKKDILSWDVFHQMFPAGATQHLMDTSLLENIDLEVWRLIIDNTNTL